MRHLPASIRSRVEESQVLEDCLIEARNRFPEDQDRIRFCGVEDNWADCLSGFEAPDGIWVILQFNIGPATYAVKKVIPNPSSP
jgi:hypothetical protein